MPAPLFSQRIHTRRTDQQHCRQLLSHGSRSFYAASLLLPQPYRDAAVSLYAFCRIADDAIDLSERPHAALAELESRLDGIYRNHPWDHPADRNMARVVRQFGIPRELLDALLEGFSWDCEVRRYPDIAAVRAYGARVAGAVGIMMALLMGQRELKVLARAADLGVAMQLTNIARDVGEDAANGRLYLPLDWMHAAGIDGETWLQQPHHCAELSRVIEQLLVEADELYARGEAGINCLPASCQPCVMTARLLYGEIGEEVRRRGHDSISSRAVVSPSRKCRVIAGLGKLGRLPRDRLDLKALPETQFLLDAVAAAPLPAKSADEGESKVEWMLDMYAELQRRDRISQQRQAVPACPLLSEEQSGETLAS